MWSQRNKMPTKLFLMHVLEWKMRNQVTDLIVTSSTPKNAKTVFVYNFSFCYLKLVLCYESVVKWCVHHLIYSGSILITCFSSIHPAASSSFNSEERLLKTYKIDVKKIKLSGNIEPGLKTRIRVGVLENTSGPSAFPSLQQAVGSLFPLETWHIAYDLLHAHSHWTTGDTCISIDCVTARRGWRTAVDLLLRGFGEYITNALLYRHRQTGTRQFDLIHRSLCLQIMDMHCAHDMIKMGLAECMCKKWQKATSAR